MKKEFVIIATVMVAILLWSVLIVHPVMSELGNGNTTSISEGEPPISIAATSDLIGKIAFSSERDGLPEIYVMNADGTNVVRLTINTALDVLPDWCSVQVMDPEVYDTNENGIIEKCEAGMAAKDYFDGKITMEQALEVLLLHFATQP